MKEKNIIIAANWKMNKTPKEAEKLISELLNNLGTHKSKIILFVPYVDLSTAIDITVNSSIEIGAQNCHWEESGAFTGEISVKMLKELGINNVIIGHSERRQYFNETNEFINKKVKLLISNKMNIILCVGETLEQMNKGEALSTISNQIELALKDVKKEDMSNIVIAYEPVWAIGTGMTATPEQANKTCEEIRKIISGLYDKEVSDNLIIQYGGSINSNNIVDILSQPNIGGGLIGGASLNSSEFVKIVNLADEITFKE